MKYVVTSSLHVDPLFQKKKGSTKQSAKACYGRLINYSNPLFKLFVKRVLTKAA